MPNCGYTILSFNDSFFSMCLFLQVGIFILAPIMLYYIFRKKNKTTKPFMYYPNNCINLSTMWEDKLCNVIPLTQYFYFFLVPTDSKRTIPIDPTSSLGVLS